MEYTFLLCLATLLFMSSVATGQTTDFTTPIPGSVATDQTTEFTTTIPETMEYWHSEKPPDIMPHFFHVGPNATELSLYDGDYETIQLLQPLTYFGKTYDHFYLSMDGYVAFDIPVVDDEMPNPHLGKDIIAPLWTDLDADEGGRWTYEQATSGPLIEEATNVIHEMGHNFSASWVFVSTWENVPLEYVYEVVSLQVVLVSNAEGVSFILMNYGFIPSIPSLFWLAGYDMEHHDFITIQVDDSSELSSGSNINLPGRWFFPVHSRPIGPPVPPNFYPFWDRNEVIFFDNDGSSSEIRLQQPFRFFASTEYTIYVNQNGLLSFSEPLGQTSPDNTTNISTNLIAALWTDFKIDNNSRVTYQEVTDGPLLFQATQDINRMFPENPFYATWLFIATWQMMPYANSTGDATFQAVLVSNGVDTSYVMLNYGEVDFTDQLWLAGYEAVDGRSSFIPEEDIFNLSSSSNVQIRGRYAFRLTDQVSSICQLLNCAWGEVCTKINGAYGCACGESSPRPNPETYDAIETCSGSSGSLSLSRCQLFEAGFPSDVLHLNDRSCRGLVQYDRLVFNFDSGVNMCGTTLEHNATHVTFKNNVGTTDGMGIISHVGGLNIAFSCVYPLIQSISMPMAFQASGNTISKDLSTEGTYQISMVPYPDLSFQNPFSGNVTLQVNQQLYISVQVEQFDTSQIALVLDNCWATPVNQMDFYVRWDLITNECPNPADGTVEVLQNGVSTFSYFSFRMFTFTGFSNNIYLHCQVHLCVQGSGNCALPCNGQDSRRQRSADFYDSAAITMKF